jgi:hypothetical protein
MKFWEQRGKGIRRMNMLERMVMVRRILGPCMQTVFNASFLMTPVLPQVRGPPPGLRALGLPAPG